MFCPKCGNELSDGSSFCSKCGEKLGGNSASNSNSISNIGASITNSVGTMFGTSNQSINPIRMYIGMVCGFIIFLSSIIPYGTGMIGVSVFKFGKFDGTFTFGGILFLLGGLYMIFAFLSRNRLLLTIAMGISAFNILWNIVLAVKLSNNFYSLNVAFYFCLIASIVAVLCALMMFGKNEIR